MNEKEAARARLPGRGSSRCKDPEVGSVSGICKEQQGSQGSWIRESKEGGEEERRSDWPSG